MNSPPLGFLSLQSRYVVKGTLETKAATHVGSGLEGTDTDSAWIRDSRGIFIPGSSLRGVMRSTLEKIVQAARPDCGCVLFLPGSHPLCATAHEKKEKEFREMPEAERLTKIFGGALCDICLLFGSSLLASRLRVSDCRLQNPAHPQPRHGVGIDRDTETAKEKIKFDFEALEEGPMFHFHIELENARPQDFALLGILFTEMQSKSGGLWIGGKKSRGLGRCVLSPNYRVTYFDNGKAFKLADYLVAGSLKEMPREDFAMHLSKAVLKFLEEGSHVSTVGQ